MPSRPNANPGVVLLALTCENRLAPRQKRNVLITARADNQDFEMLRMSRRKNRSLPEDSINYTHQHCEPEESCHFIPRRQKGSVLPMALYGRGYPGEYTMPEAKKRYCRQQRIIMMQGQGD